MKPASIRRYEVQVSARDYGGRALIEALLPQGKPLAWLLHLSVEARSASDTRHFIDMLLDEIEVLPIDLTSGVLAASLRMWMDREGLVVDSGEAHVADEGTSGARRSRKSRVLQEERQAAAWLDEAGRLVDAHPGSDGALAHLKRLHQKMSALLHARLDAPERKPDDWSIHLPRPLAGELGEKLMTFLSASTQTRLVWPLAKEKRMAVHRFIDQHELPVSHQTERTGCPHKRILEKKASLHAQEARQRLLWAHDLNLLNRFHAVFCGGGGRA